MDASKAQRPKRISRAFTLIELLTVVVIIGILAGLITAAVIKARTFVKERKIRAEIDLMQRALEAYKNRFNDYPPDFTGANRQAAIMRHLAVAFPKYRATWAQFKADVANASGLDVDTLDASSALVFWLGGIPEGSGPIRLTGFSANAASPFQNSSQSPARIEPMFAEIDPERVLLIGGQVRYYPDEPLASEAGQAPYIYFRNRAGVYNPGAQKWSPDGGGQDVLPMPYAKGGWPSAKSFQIICAGLDGRFGNTTNGDPPYYPSGGNYSAEHLDNMTNFCAGTLDDDMD